MPAPFFIVGPTAVGKSSLAVKVAARCGAEIVGADAFQVYQGFNLLTAKPTSMEQEQRPHHLIGTIPASETYNVARYLEDAQRCLESIFRRGQSVIVVGGTGLYVKALTHGLSPLPEADPAIRAELEPLNAPALLTRLHLLDPHAAITIDPHNKRRLVRAIEVCLLTGRPFSTLQNLWTQKPQQHPSNGVFLVRPKADLHARIERRVTAMFARGVVEEVRAVLASMLSPTASRMIGWQDIQDYLAGHQTLAECQEKIRGATRQYAKRQITWFQREKSFTRVDLSTLPDEPAQIDLISKSFLMFTGQA